MRAVNLVPKDLRSAGAAGGGSGSPAGAYAVLAALGLLVVLAATWAVSARQVDDRRAEVARLDAEAQAAEAQVQGLAGYEETVAVAKARRTALVGLANGRFDWADALREVSRTVPKGAWLTKVAGTVSPGVTVEGAGSNPLRASTPTPAIEILGCTPSHDDVARLMARLRAMDGVQKVSLSTSEKSDQGSAGGSAGSARGGGDDCRMGSDRIPQFNMVVFFKAPAAAAGTTAAGTTGAAAAAAPAPAAPAPGGAK